MSKAKITDKTKLELAILAGGCCERCGIYLYEDFLTKTKTKFAEHAHMIADSDNGPRGDSDYVEYKEGADNLMLLCSNCHTIIDKNPEEFSVECLHQIKTEHEKRVRYLLSIPKDNKAQIVLYNTRIYQKEAIFNLNAIRSSVVADGFYPLGTIIDISNKNNLTDDTKEYYDSHVLDLEENFRYELNKFRENKGKIFLYALAPQPLLIKLGTLLNKSFDVIVKNLSRETGWRWNNGESNVEFLVNKPQIINEANTICLKLNISDEIVDQRIEGIFDDGVDIWEITVPSPNLYKIKNQGDLDKFSIIVNSVMNEIKNVYGQKKLIHVFPAVSNALAVEFGRCYMPKVYNPMILYDATGKEKNFIKTIEI